MVDMRGDAVHTMTHRLQPGFAHKTKGLQIMFYCKRTNTFLFSIRSMVLKEKIGQTSARVELRVIGVVDFGRPTCRLKTLKP